MQVTGSIDASSTISVKQVEVATGKAVSSSFAQKSAVSGSLGLVTGVNTGGTVISGSATSTGSFGRVETDNLTVGGSQGSDGQVLTSTGAGVAWEAGGGDLSFGGDTFGADKTIGSNDTYSLSFETDGTERLKLHSDGRGLSQFTAKAWAYFSGGGTPSFYNYHNCSTITDSGTGQYSINFTNNMASADYAAVATAGGSSWYNIIANWGGNSTTGYCKLGVLSTSGGGAYVDDAHISLVVFGT
jgi:hypothetical protein